ncbi:MAG: DUF4065 domain-containing protein [Deltaproteobacteria bacterium]|nr:DUF4065 domain-containing protein [Deltaproteobacteria bacterium]
MIVTHQRERLINAIIYFAKNTKYCGKTKLMKLLYFFDFFYFQQTGKTITGLEYETWERGPVPRKLYEELSSMKADLSAAIAIVPLEKINLIKAKEKFENEHFAPKQLQLLEKVAYIFRDARAEDMTEISHLKHQPWDTTLKHKGMYQKIDYLLAIDGSKECLCAEDACDIRNEIDEMYEIFGIDKDIERNSLFPQ